MTSSARRAVLLLALITAATAQAGDSPWRHSDVPARHFDSSHDWWKDRSSRAALAPMVIESESVQYRYAGAMDTVTVTHETVYRIRDAAAAPRALWLGSVGSEGLDAVLDFEARLVEPAGTEEVGRERLIVRGVEDGERYLAGRRAVLLTPPGGRTGRLAVRSVIRNSVLGGVPGFIAGSYQPHTSVPTSRCTVEIVVPVVEELRLEQRPFELPVEESTTEELRTLQVEFRDLAPVRLDSATAPPVGSLPTLFWSNSPSWSHLGEALSELWESHVAPTPAIEAWLAGRATSDGTAAERALEVHDLVAAGWDYLGFYPDESGWIPHAAEVCLGARPRAASRACPAAARRAAS
ncbi:MAG: hypothetical protein GY898_09250 [Proteobacteria bacterium]|nr:hypothetical protein [Pseudomonadota bacterium]